MFKFLFKDKGKACPHKFGKFYTFEDFDNTFFSSEWNKCYDQLGNGCRLEFPLRMHNKIQWSPVVYLKDSSGALYPKNKTYDEVCSVYICKARC